MTMSSKSRRTENFATLISRFFKFAGKKWHTAVSLPRNLDGAQWAASTMMAKLG
jgi:hypothetical protein